MISVSLRTPFNCRVSARVVALAGCLFAGTVGAAHATTPAADVPSVVVSFSDLNLSTEQGTSALYHRIVAAARQVCPQADQRDLSAYTYSRACQEAAIARAVNDVHSSHLAAVHAAHSKRG
jgi:UrcA family protein